MKKWLGLVTMAAFLFVFSVATAETVDWRKELNPNDYDVLEVYDIFSNDDSEMDENGNFYPVSPDRPLILQGCFGRFVTLESEEDGGPITEGFDENAVQALEIADDCVAMMPKDWMDPVENIRCDDLEAWYTNMTEGFNEMINSVSNDGEPVINTFFAKFTMDKEGRITSLEYIYIP